MLPKAVTITSKMMEQFTVELIKEIAILDETLNKFGINILKVLPEAIREKSIVHAVYSHDKQHVLIKFGKSGHFSFHGYLITGDVFDIFDPDGVWKNSPVAMRIDNSYVNLKNIRISGLKPFELFGKKLEMIIEDLEFDGPSHKKVKVEFAFVFSCDVFHARLSNIREFVSDLSKVYLEYHKKSKQEITQNLVNIKTKMEKLFFDEKIRELEIDNFIRENPLILECCLGLINPLHQVTLINIHGDNPKDFKPDLIAFDQNEKVWKIVDYKRAKRKIIINVGKARSHFKAEVDELEGQLDDYRKYFEDKMQREYINKKYGVLIEDPLSVGIIGNIHDNEIKDFNRIKNRLPRGFELIPYNFLYDRFCRFIDLSRKINV